MAWCSQKLSQDELFEKKKECASYKNIIEKEIEERNFWNQVERLESIFYSSTKNTCMYYVNWSVNYTTQKWGPQSREWQRVYDYFTKEVVLRTPVSCKNYEGDNIWYIIWSCLEDNFDEKLQELKWE